MPPEILTAIRFTVVDANLRRAYGLQHTHIFVIMPPPPYGET